MFRGDDVCCAGGEVSVVWEEVDAETLALSEHPDIDIRGEVCLSLSPLSLSLSLSLPFFLLSFLTYLLP